LGRSIDVGFLRPPIPGADLQLEHVRDEILIAARSSRYADTGCLDSEVIPRSSSQDVLAMS
jgi:hypothetical protein